MASSSLSNARTAATGTNGSSLNRHGARRGRVTRVSPVCAESWQTSHSPPKHEAQTIPYAEVTPQRRPTVLREAKHVGE